MDCSEILPSNLRWFYALEDLADDEFDENVKKKMRKCQESLAKYPITVHDVDHLQLLQHMNSVIFDKLKARLRLEQNFIKKEPPPPVSRIHENFENRPFSPPKIENNLSREEQEQNDLALAMQLSQELNYDPEPMAADLDFKPSSAFADTPIQANKENLNQRNVHDISFSPPEVKQEPRSRQASPKPSTSNDVNSNRKPNPLASLIAQDPVFRNMDFLSDDDDEDKVREDKKKVPTKRKPEKQNKLRENSNVAPDRKVGLKALLAQDPVLRLGAISSDEEDKKPAKKVPKQNANNARSTNLDDFLAQDPVLNRFNGRSVQPPKKKAKKAETSASSTASSSSSKKKSSNPLSDFLSQDTVLSQAIGSDESDTENGNESQNSNKKRKR